ncbi:MAG: putative metal-dependent hydrolase YcfH [Firmicutes bacterium]|nr:putative metal-dependent hydrolase YcfH [Bacillota bacterium]MBT9152417.1 putative metal-dependent hydrolase YcfH [Bacillota bacterium]MBT9157947.1 putative metal-dependent hydrolase YcfH [Bacillota bacterium]
MKSFLIDSHAHLNDERFAPDLPEILLRASAAGVLKILTVGYNMSSSQSAVQLASGHEMVWAAVGIHPHDAPECREDNLEQLRAWLTAGPAVGLGEIGLDYYWNTWDKEVQKKAFREQIELAKSLAVPFIVHNRDAHGDVLAVLKEHGPYPAGFVMHCFSGSAELALCCLRLNGFISFAGPVTFQNASQVVRAAKAVPLERLLLETDCPYLSPHPLRGQRNEPARVTLVAEALAGILGVEFEELARRTTNNAEALFCPGGMVR